MHYPRMSASQLPADLSEYPLWRLLVMLDDLEREVGASAPSARAVAREVAGRLGVISLDTPVSGAVAAGGEAVTRA